MSQISDSHDIWCNCNGPFAHLLASIFPPGHQDRVLTVNQILKRDFQESCHSGGDAGENSGVAGADADNINQDIKLEEEDKEDIEELLAAAAAAEREQR